MTDILQLIPGYDPYRDAGDCVYDHDAGQRVVDFFADCVTHVKGELAGQPYLMRPHEECITRNLFGWKRPDGTRRYRQCLYFVPRKNSKTTWAAGVSLYLLTADGEAGAEVYSAAGARDQAAIVYQIMAAMVRNDEQSDEPYLANLLRIYTATKVIEYPARNSIYKALSAEASNIHGTNSSAVIFDELHTQPNEQLYDVLRTSVGSRKQPLFLSTTTSDFARDSVCNRLHEYASKVRDGVINDPYFLPVIYEATIEDDWTDPKVWAKANPNMGYSFSLDFMAEQCRRAQEEPLFENTFKRLHLNIQTEQDVRWITLEEWDACAVDFDKLLLEGEECYPGVDLASTTDIAAMTLFFPKFHFLLPFFWLPENAGLKRDKGNRDLYLRWRRDGLIEFTRGDVIDYGFIRKRINEISKKYNVREIPIDPWNARQFSLQLQEQDGLPVAEFRQGYKSMNEPCKRLDAMIRSRELQHDGNPVLRWMASNVTVRVDPAGSIKIDKEKSANKVDGIVAAVMGIGSWLAANYSPKSVYEERGVLTV